MSSDVLRALGGGVLIGLAAAILLLLNGRIAGVSGIVGRVWSNDDKAWRVSFVLGLVLGGGALSLVAPGVFGPPAAGTTLQLALAGLLVGTGTQLANGCTSGHGVCGIGRGSVRSIASTVTFMIAGALVVFMVRA